LGGKHMTSLFILFLLILAVAAALAWLNEQIGSAQ
jgi:hypothetical protein